MTWQLRPLERGRLAEAQILLRQACAYDRAAEVAEEVLFGPAFGHEALHDARPLAGFAGGRLRGVVVVSGPWLRLLAVHPDARGRGLGTALLDAGERAILASECAQGGLCTIRVMDQPGNYLAPGVDARDLATTAWLARRGYREHRENHNLLVELAGNPNVSEQRAAACAEACARAPGLERLEIRRARVSERHELLAWVAGEFSPAWAFSVGRALELSPAAVHLARTPGGAIAAFAAHDSNNQGLGWFGPTGTAPAYRGRGLGTALLLACLVDIRRAGHDVCEIAWIGPRQFYQRAVGVIGERRFIVFTKDCSV